MKKIIVEIDGQRHRLIYDGADAVCYKCTLRDDCESPICSALGLPCCHFEKEEEVCG